MKIVLQALINFVFYNYLIVYKNLYIDLENNFLLYVYNHNLSKLTKNEKMGLNNILLPGIRFIFLKYELFNKNYVH